MFLAIFVTLILAPFFLLIVLGKGDNLIAGYNTATKEEKSKYNAKKLCRVVGAGMSVITLLIFVMGIGMDVIPYYFAYVTLAIVLIDCVVMLILMNTICKK